MSTLNKRPIETLVLSDDSDQEGDLRTPVESVADEKERRELAEALALSLQEQQASTSTTVAAQTSTSLNAPSRAELELERLERQRQREANGTQTTSRVTIGPASKRIKVATLSDVISNDSDEPNEISRATNSNSAQTSNSAEISCPPASKRFWSASIETVKNKNVSDSNTFTFQSILAKSENLQKAICGAFCLDPIWVAGHFDAETPLLLFLPQGSKDKISGIGQLDASIKPNCYRVCPPNRLQGQFGTMHTKLIILYYERFCRVIIPTANLVEYDWSIISNQFFVQDFPILSKETEISCDPAQNPTHTKFSSDLLRQLIDLGIPQQFRKDFCRYDFTRSAHVRLVVSLQGRFPGWHEMEKGGGICSLASAVKSLGFSTADFNDWTIEAQGSSIPAFTNNWLAQIFAACCGIHPKEFFNSKQILPPKFPQIKSNEPTPLPIKIVFPTENYVLGSFGSVNHGGTIFCDTKKWQQNGFPSHLFHQNTGKNPRVTSHTKTIVALQKPNSKNSSLKPGGWIYVGSHNFTLSAWGRLQKCFGYPAQMMNNNYELGVIMKIPGGTAQEIEAKADEFVGYRRPLVKYTRSDLPWCQDKYK